MSTFDQWRASKLRPPTNGPFDQSMAAALGEQQQDELELLRVAMLSRFPTTCPDDALDALGATFAIPRFDGEPNGTLTTGYRGRLCAAWPTKKKAGSAQAIIDSLNAWGLPDVEVYEAHELRFLPSNPMLPYVPPCYSAFIVVLGPDFGSTGIAPLTAPFPGGSTVGGSTATIKQVRQIVAQVFALKSVHSYFAAVILRFDAAILGGINSFAPFTPPINAAYSKWDVGKLVGFNVINGPYTPGGYYYRDE